MTALRHITHAALAATALLAGAQGAVACTMITKGKVLDALDDIHYRNTLYGQSKPVQQARDCSFENGGLEDEIHAGPAFDAGNQRTFQYLMPRLGGKSAAMVVDCATREAIGIVSVLKSSVGFEEPTILGCPVLHADGFPAWGVHTPASENEWYEYADVAGRAAPVSIAAAETMADLAKAAEKVGLEVNETLRGLVMDGFHKPYRQKDRIDLLCGCKLFYPESAGGQG